MLLTQNNELQECEECDGVGLFHNADPGVTIVGIPRGWQIIERCDACELYSSDLDAAKTITAQEPRWIRSESGGWHAIGLVDMSKVKTNAVSD